MQIFKGIKSFYKRSEASIVVQNLLEIQAKELNFSADPAMTARLLVENVWNQSPHLFDGRFGQRPHKISVAAIAFSNEIEVQGIDDPRHPLVASLLKVLDNVADKGYLYPLNSLDKEHLESASKVCESIMSASPIVQEVESLMKKYNVTWEIWYSEYKRSAGERRIDLAPKDNLNGLSLIDLMEDEPLRKAHQDGMNPTSLGKQFAENFDVTKMGMS
jgi:hypothetical protein